MIKFERVCYGLKLKVTKIQLPIPNGFCAVLKNQLGMGADPKRIKKMCTFVSWDRLSAKVHSS